MPRILLGALAMALLLGGGFALIQAQRQDDTELAGLPPPELAEQPAANIPQVDVEGLEGPAPPEATELTREQKRFGRYDRNSDQIITRLELMASRTKAFRKLDTDGNNLLTFEEWAVATGERFAKADANGDDRLSPSEFATTKPKRKAKSACRC